LLADFLNPGVVGAAEAILEINVGREGDVQERGIDDLCVDAEFIEIRILASISVNSWLPIEKVFSRARREVAGVPNSDNPLPLVRGTTAPSMSQKEFCPKSAG